MTSSQGHPRLQKRRRLVGAVAAVLILALLAVGVAVYLVPSPVPALTSTSLVNQKVEGAFVSHLQSIVGGNVGAVVNQYAGNATVGLSGTIPGLVGTYTGSANLRTIWTTLLSSNEFATVNVRNLTYSVSVSASGLEADVNADFGMAGNSTYLGSLGGSSSPAMGTYVATVNSRTSFALVGGSWLISSENWNFTSLAFS